VKYCPLYTCTSVFFDPCVLIHSSAIFGNVRLSKPKATLTASCVVFYSGGKHGHCESHAWSNDFVRFCMWVGQRGQSSRFSPGTPAILGDDVAHGTPGPAGLDFRWKLRAARGRQRLVSLAVSLLSRYQVVIQSSSLIEPSAERYTDTHPTSDRRRFVFTCM